MIRLQTLLVAAALLLGAALPTLAEVPASHAMVATVHPLATEAGLAALKSGGNAVDAAVAAALTLGVVDGHNSGIGGGCFILIRTADGQLIAIDGRETAPAKATRDMYLRDGVAVAQLSQTGPLAVAVPGALAAYEHAVVQFGKSQLEDLLVPAAKIAEEGFAIDRIYAARLKAEAESLRAFAGSSAVLLKADGQPLAEGDTLQQPDLARTYRDIAEQGTSWFYRGEFATAVARWMASSGGILTAEDFAAYRTELREPLVSTYRDYTVVGFPPPSSGGVHVAQILNILENFDLRAEHNQEPAQAMHVVSEAMKLAFADRAFWLGDPDFAKVPRGLIDQGYANELAQRIDRAKAAKVKSHSVPPGSDRDFFGKHTTHIAAADAAGNWAAITATVNTSFGSKVIVPGTGVILNNQMDDFSAQPGVPNAFGLVGGDANAIEPGKRPLSSMSPTIVLKDDQPVMTVGAAGGPKIITQVVLAIVQHLDYRMGLDKALAAPRYHHQWSPDVLQVETDTPKSVIASLQAAGHTVRVSSDAGTMQAISLSPDRKTFIGVADPRVLGKAAGY